MTAHKMVSWIIIMNPCTRIYFGGVMTKKNKKSVTKKRSPWYCKNACDFEVSFLKHVYKFKI